MTARVKKRIDTATNRESDKIITRLPRGVRADLAKLAAQHGRSVNAEVVLALTRHIAFETGQAAGEGIIFSEHGLFQISKRLEAGLNFFDQMLFDVRDIDLEAFISDQRGRGFNLTRAEAIRKILREYLGEHGYVRGRGERFPGIG
jgi:plasmid stability protein